MLDAYPLPLFECRRIVIVTQLQIILIHVPHFLPTVLRKLDNLRFQKGVE